MLGYNSDAAGAASAKEQILAKYDGTTVHTVQGDISRPDTISALFACVRDNFDGQLTAFVHNAGLYVGITSQRLVPAFTDLH